MNSWKMETWLWPLPTRNCSVQNSFLKWIHSNLRFYWVIPNCSCLDVGHRLPKKSALAAKSAVHSQEKGITPSLSTLSWGSLYITILKKKCSPFWEVLLKKDIVDLENQIWVWLSTTLVLSGKNVASEFGVKMSKGRYDRHLKPCMYN